MMAWNELSEQRSFLTSPFRGESRKHRRRNAGCIGALCESRFILLLSNRQISDGYVRCWQCSQKCAKSRIRRTIIGIGVRDTRVFTAWSNL